MRYAGDRVPIHSMLDPFPVQSVTVPPLLFFSFRIFFLFSFLYPFFSFLLIFYFRGWKRRMEFAAARLRAKVNSAMKVLP